MATVESVGEFARQVHGLGIGFAALAWLSSYAEELRRSQAFRAGMILKIGLAFMAWGIAWVLAVHLTGVAKAVYLISLVLAWSSLLVLPPRQVA